MGVYLPYTRLPSTYQEVEYIESSGTQYINTGYKPKVSSGFDVKFNHVSHPGSYNTILGTRQSTTANSFWIGTQVSNGNSYGEFTQSVHPLGFSFSSVGTDYTVTFQNTALDKTLKCGQNSQVFSFTQDTSYNLYLFAGNQQDGGLFEPAAIKMYYCKIYENLILVRDFIPCYRKSDNVIGLYDKVNDTFYVNSGSGSFSKGADVVMTELKNAYIGEFNPKDLLSNIIAYYPMQGNLNDTSGNGYNLSVLSGSYTGGTTYNTITNLKANNTSVTYSGTSSFTISVWGDLTSVYPLLVLGDDDASGWGLQVKKTIAYAVVNNSQYNTTAITEPTGWHMYSAVFNYPSHTISFYLDGVLKATASTASGGIRGSSRIVFGYVSSSGTASSSGKLGISFITNNASTDLLEFYNATKSNYGL